MQKGHFIIKKKILYIGKSRKRKSDQQGESSNSTRGSSGSKSSKSTKKAVVNVYWAEVYLEKERRWIPIDLETGRYELNLRSNKVSMSA